MYSRIIINISNKNNNIAWATPAHIHTAFRTQLISSKEIYLKMKLSHKPYTFQTNWGRHAHAVKNTFSSKIVLYSAQQIFSLHYWFGYLSYIFKLVNP